MGESQRSCHRHVRDFLNAEFSSLIWIFISTSTSKQHLEQSFNTGDLRKLIDNLYGIYICIDIICNLLAPLTKEEVAAIDAAGAKGPPGRSAPQNENKQPIENIFN
jgi:hypothetical protein